MTISCDHIDTCLSCYVLDHCNGVDEFLLGVPVDGTRTYREVKYDLFDELHHSELPELMTHEAARVAINEAFATVDPDHLFNASLDVPPEDPDDDDYELCYAWFRLSVD